MSVARACESAAQPRAHAPLHAPVHKALIMTTHMPAKRKHSGWETRIETSELRTACEGELIRGAGGGSIQADPTRPSRPLRIQVTVKQYPYRCSKYITADFLLDCTTAMIFPACRSDFTQILKLHLLKGHACGRNGCLFCSLSPRSLLLARNTTKVRLGTIASAMHE